MKIEIKIKDFQVVLSDETDKSIQYNYTEITKLISDVVESYNKIDKK
jgi:hypothetical protein